MLIRKLHLENFKCFKNFDAEFSESINLIIGRNTSGKTTLLEGLSVAIGSFWMKLSEVEKRDIEKDEIRVEPLSGFPEFQFPVVVQASGNVLDEEEVFWTRELNSVSGGITSINAKQIEKLSLRAQETVGRDEGIVLPIIAYFSTTRLSNDRKKPRQGKEPIGKLRGYYNALNDTNTRRYIQDWFGDRERWVVQNKNIGREVNDEGIALLRNIIKVVLPGVKHVFYFDPQIQAERPEMPEGLYLVNGGDNILHESQFSDGYRNLLWLFIEIAWRCYMLNPLLGIKANEGTNGVVLIDEVDLHLHPALQQQVVGMLAETFPKVQFILTTHSPIVVGSVTGNLKVLDEFKLINIEDNPFGKDASYIIRNMMGVDSRQPEVKSLIDRYFELINEGKGNDKTALQIREELDEMLGASDPALVKADTLLSLFN